MRKFRILRQYRFFGMVAGLAALLPLIPHPDYDSTARANTIQAAQFATVAAQGLADAITSIQSAQQAQLNQQLASQLESNQAIIIQAAMSDSIQKLRGALQEGFGCLQRNSVLPSTGKAKPAVLGKKCKRDEKDVGILEKEPDELSCGIAKKAIDIGSSEDKFQKCRIDQLNLLNNVVGCFSKMNSQVESAASTLTQFINQRTQFAQQTLDSLDANIRARQRVEDLVTRELDGPDGYKAQVTDLTNIAFALDNALDEFSPGAGRTVNQEVELSDGSTIQIASGLKDRVDNLYNKEMDRIGNNWYRGLVGQVRACLIGGAPPSSAANIDKFAQAFPFACDKGIGVTNGVFACLEAQACASARGNTNETGLCNRAKRVLGQTAANISAAEFITSQNFAGKFDLNSPDGRGAVIDAAFGEVNKLQAIINQSLASFASGSQGVRGPATGIDFTGQIERAVRQCKAFAEQNFESALSTDDETNNVFRRDLTILQKLRSDLLGDTNRAIEQITQRMTKFRTKFTNVFDNTLKQFSENCRSTADPRRNLACLEQLRNMLKGGIDGTNGEPPTTIQVPIVDLTSVNPNTPFDSGSPVLNTQNLQCRGFNDCIQQLELVRRINSEQRDQLKEQKIQEAQEHNQIVQSVIDQIGAVFNQSVVGPSGIESFMSTVQKALDDNNISGVLGLKDREKESLEINEDSNEDAAARIFGTPDSVLNVMGKTIGLKMVDEDSICRVRTGSDCSGGRGRPGKGSIQGKLADAGDDRSKAQEIASAGRDKLKKCTPKRRDYESISIGLKDCASPAKVCESGLPRALAEVKSVGKITLDQADEEDDRQLSSSDRQKDESFAECKQRLESGGLSGVSDVRILLQSKREPPDPAERREIAFLCMEKLYDRGLELFKGARDQYRTRHDKLMSQLDELIGKCDKYDKERFDQEVASIDTFGRAADRDKASVRACIGSDEGKEPISFEESEVGKRIAEVEGRAREIGAKVNDRERLIKFIADEVKAGRLKILGPDSDDPMKQEERLKELQLKLEEERREFAKLEDARTAAGGTLTDPAKQAAYVAGKDSVRTKERAIAELTGKISGLWDAVTFQQLDAGSPTGNPLSLAVLSKYASAYGTLTGKIGDTLSFAAKDAIDRPEILPGIKENFANMLNSPEKIEELFKAEAAGGRRFSLNTVLGTPFRALPAEGERDPAYWKFINSIVSAYDTNDIISDAESLINKSLQCHRTDIRSPAQVEEQVSSALATVDDFHREDIESSCKDIASEVSSLARNAERDIEAIEADEDDGGSAESDDIVRTRRSN